MDGLLVDSEPIQFEASQLLFRQYGHRFTVKHLKKFLGVRLVEELATLKREWKLQPDVKEFMAKRRNIFLRLIRKKLKLAKGAGELLKFLRQIGLPVGLGTSAEHWYVDEVMKKFNIRHHFDVIVSSEQVQKVNQIQKSISPWQNTYESLRRIVLSLKMLLTALLRQKMQG